MVDAVVEKGKFDDSVVVVSCLIGEDAESGERKEFLGQVGLCSWLDPNVQKYAVCLPLGGATPDDVLDFEVGQGPAVLTLKYAWFEEAELDFSEEDVVAKE